jgi:hypothetical protein
MGLVIGSQTLRDKLDLMSAADYAITRNADKATQNGSGVPIRFFPVHEYRS